MDHMYLSSLILGKYPLEKYDSELLGHALHDITTSLLSIPPVKDKMQRIQFAQGVIKGEAK